MERELKSGDLLKDPETGALYIFLGVFIEEGGKTVLKIKSLMVGTLGVWENIIL